MNPTKLRKLADVIESAPKDTFDMSLWFTTNEADNPFPSVHGGSISPHCGTAGCIAGWTCSTFLPPGEEISESDVETTAKRLLEAKNTHEEDVLEALFTYSGYWLDLNYPIQMGDLETVTQEMAAMELRRLAERVEANLPLM